jgi:isopenicillin N synthase-like dioxygenase
MENSMTLRKVPVLSLKHYHSSKKEEQKEFVDALYNSFKEYGFVVIKDHNIPKELMTKAYKMQEELFKLPEEVKKKFFLNNGGQRGYTPFGSENAKGYSVKDLKEFWHIGREYKPEEAEYTMYPHNVWVPELTNFKETFTELYDLLEKTGNDVLEALTYNLDVEKDFFKVRTYNGNTVMRLLHYPPVPDHLEPNQIRAQAHSDIDLLTTLIAAQGSGLQLLDKNGKWLDIQANPDEIVINMGDMLSRITNDVLPSTIHRVVNPADPTKNTSRYSLPCFFHPRHGVMLQELPKFKGQGKKYPDIESDEFLQQRLKEIGLKK